MESQAQIIWNFAPELNKVSVTLHDVLPTYRHSEPPREIAARSANSFTSEHASFERVSSHSRASGSAGGYLAAARHDEAWGSIGSPTRASFVPSPQMSGDCFQRGFQG